MYCLGLYQGGALAAIEDAAEAYVKDTLEAGEEFL